MNSIPLSTIQKYFFALGDNGRMFQAMLEEIYEKPADNKEKK